MSRSACDPPVPPSSLLHTLCFTDAGSVQHTPLQKYGVAAEDVHLVGRGCSLSVGQVMICLVSGEFVIFVKYVRFANMATFVARNSPMLTLASCVVFSHENG